MTENLNLKNIYEGQLVKNYKELCTLLGQVEMNGNSKKYQVNNWKRYFDFEKIGQKILITEIYPTPFPTDDARKRREGLYVKYIELLIMNKLSKEDGHKFAMTRKALYKMLGMVGNNYKNNFVGYDKIKTAVDSSIGYDISSFDINHFYQRADQKLSNILNSALKSMANRCLIEYKEERTIVTEYTNDKGETVYDYRIANDDEDKMILRAKNDVLNEMGLYSLTEVMLKFKSKEYFDRVDSYVKSHYGWSFVYSQISIIYLDDIGKQVPIKAEEIRRLSAEIQRKDLNKTIIDTLNQQAEDKYNRIQDMRAEQNEARYSFNNDNTEVPVQPTIQELEWYNDAYVAIQQGLANYLMRL